MSKPEYAERAATNNSDGTPLMANNYDRANEDEVRTVLEKAWNCSIRSFGRLSPVDFYAERHGRLVGVLELKSRTHESTRYATVFLNVRKWMALQMAGMGLGCPALFVVRFTDGLRYILVDAVDATQVRMGGGNRKVSSHTDIEPVIEVPIRSMETP